jgi:hypothetical protein
VTYCQIVHAGTNGQDQATQALATPQVVGGGGSSRLTARPCAAPGATANGRPVHLAGLYGPHHPCGAGPTPGRRRPEEVPAFARLLADLDLAGVVVAADALQTHAEAAEFLVTQEQATTCSRSRPTSPSCWTAAPACPGTGSR